MKRITLFLLTFYFMVFALSSLSVQAQENHHIKIVIDHTKIDEDLSDFPVLIHLSKNSGINGFDASELITELPNYNDRKKISVITESSEECYVEIEKWDPINSEAILWVKVPEISSTEDTILKLYYDATQANNTLFVGDIGDSPAKNVWTGYLGVWHFTSDYSESAANRITVPSTRVEIDENGITDIRLGPCLRVNGGDGYGVKISNFLLTYLLILMVMHLDLSKI